MAIVTRYFSTTSAGAGDGTTWADRAALFSSGNWSSVITGFNFSGSDSLECRIEGGLTYTCSQVLASALFTNPPNNRLRPLLLAGCDSSGNVLIPTHRVAAESPLDTTTFPVITNGANVGLINGNSTTHINLWALEFNLSFTAILGVASVNANHSQFIKITATSTASYAGAYGAASNGFLLDSDINNNAGNTGYAVAANSAVLLMKNCRLTGSTGSAGGRGGIITSTFGATLYVVDSLINNFDGNGIDIAGSNNIGTIWLVNNCINDVGGHGIFTNNPSAASGQQSSITNNVITNCGGYGINLGTNTQTWLLAQSRLRSNTSGNTNNMGEVPPINNYTAAGTDADEFVNAAAGDYRIKYGSAYWGLGIGAGDEPAPSGGGGSLSQIIGAA